MKAISIKQPYASQIARGEKTIEVRSWPTKYRGDILIAVSASPKIEPFGCALCLAEIVDCRPMCESDEIAAMSKLPSEGAWAWRLANIRPIVPFPVKGRLGIYELDVRVRKIGQPSLAATVARRRARNTLSCCRTNPARSA